MKECTLLHMGDIHYPDIDKDKCPVDLKDPQFPERLEGIFTKKSYSIILQELLEEVHKDEKSPIAILISGDLTTYGDMEIYQNCLSSMKKRIPGEFCKKAKPQRLFIVPGNHDIDRTLFSESSLAPKFEPIIKALKANGFPEIPFPTVKMEELSVNSSGELFIISINSCWGCGERRHYPERIKDALSKLFDYPEEKDAKEEIMKLCYENIDTPIFSDEDINKVVKSIESIDGHCLPVIITHHNLLPQRAPRVAIYTELINSGHMRERLLQLDRPIIYLHGHIHDDPIEIIRSPRYKNSCLICISAPLLMPNKRYQSPKSGFNKIRIIYEDQGTPIGCEITLFRLADAGDKVDKKTERVSFLDPAHSEPFADVNDKKILNFIPSKEIYLKDLKTEIEKNEGESFEIAEIEKRIDALSWLGLVEYTRRNEKTIEIRKVRRLIP